MRDRSWWMALAAAVLVGSLATALIVAKLLGLIVEVAACGRL